MAKKTAVYDLLPIREHLGIDILMSVTPKVTDLSPLSQYKKTEKYWRLIAAKSKVFYRCKVWSALENYSLMRPALIDINAKEFLSANSKCLLIYKTVHLTGGGKTFLKNWKAILKLS